jgi:hypothetical protein
VTEPAAQFPAKRDPRGGSHTNRERGVRDCFMIDTGYAIIDTDICKT